MSIPQLEPTEFEKFRSFIYENSGIRIGQRKVSLLSNRIRRRLKACGCEDFKTYYRFLTSPNGTGEMEYFLDAITTNETSFYRTPAHFQWLESTLIPEVIAAKRRGERPASLRFWSAACANGAEPYSIAISMAESRFRLQDWSIKILGTDISEQEINQARLAEFKSRALEAVPDRKMRRYFQQSGDDRWQLKPGIRSAVEFGKHNLMLPIERPPFDCVFLCNVLIYFDQPSKQQVIQNIINAMVDGGYLVVGPSEGIFDMLRPLKKISTLLYQKDQDSPRRTGLSSVTEVSDDG